MEKVKTTRESNRPRKHRLLVAFAFPLLLVPSVTSAQTPAPTTGDAQEFAPAYPPPPTYSPPQHPGDGPNPSLQPPVRASNAIYAEVMGNAIFWSLDYERFFADAISGRIGVGYVPLGAKDGEASARKSITIAPLTINYLMGDHSSHKFELGAGCLVFFPGSWDSESGTVFMGTLTMGYRYAPYDGGAILRAGLTSPFGHGVFFWPWPGVSFGYAF